MSHAHATEPAGGHDSGTAWRWFWRGAAHVFSVPSLILIASFTGFAGLARETGITLDQLVLMVALVWAMPSLIILIGVISAGGGLVAASVAVALSAVRLLPMVVAWVPVIRDERTPRWQLLLLSHFVAVTSWVFAMVHLPSMPRAARVPFFTAFAVGCNLINMAIVAVVYFLVGQFPIVVTIGLLMLTPLYFLLSMLSAARVASDKVAMALGLVLGPVFFQLTPGVDILWTGLIGGTAAYGGAKAVRAWRRP